MDTHCQRAAMRRVGAALAGRYAEIGDTVAARIIEEIPAYRDAAPEVLSDLRAGATATIELLARTFAEGSTVRREDLGFLRDLAARRVHQGSASRSSSTPTASRCSPIGTNAPTRPRA